MFREASLKLTAWYLAILMLISFFFSAALYEVASREINLGLRPIPAQTQSTESSPLDDILGQWRSERVQESENRILSDLIYFNLIILFAGGAASYLLAKRTLKPIEEAHESQSRFAADASHELRTPLSAMRSEIEVALRAKTISTGETNTLLKSNLEEINKLTVLSDSLLKLARYQNGLPEKTLNDGVELEKVVEAAVKNLRKATEAKEISAETNIGKIKVAGDESMLTELLTIILDNAIKYSPEHTKVSIVAKKSGKEVNLSIKDEGIGINEKDLPHIFDRFYRADSSRGETKGYGIGLSLANEIVKIHHGKIAVASEINKGTEITITLPLAS